MAWRRDNGRPLAEAHLEPGEIFSPCAAAALYRRDVFLDAGGFDESFFAYYEDSDLAFRLRLLGAPMPLRAPTRSSSTWASRRRARRARSRSSTPSGTSSGRGSRTCPGPLLAVYLLQHLLVNLLNVGWYAARGQAGPVLRSKLAAIRGLPAILRERRQLQARRAVTSRELRARMEKGAGAYLTGFKRAWATWRRRRTPQAAQSSRRTNAPVALEQRVDEPDGPRQLDHRRVEHRCEVAGELAVAHRPLGLEAAAVPPDPPCIGADPAPAAELGPEPPLTDATRA